MRGRQGPRARAPPDLAGIIWTLPSAGGDTPGVETGEARPLCCRLAEGAICRPRAHCEQLSTGGPAGRRSDLADLKLEVPCSRERVRSWCLRVVNRVGDSPGWNQGKLTNTVAIARQG